VTDLAGRPAAAPAPSRPSLGELRAAVEPEAARLAAARGPADTGRELLGCFRLLHEAGTSAAFATDPAVRQRFRAAEEQFHAALLRGSRNELFADLAGITSPTPAAGAASQMADRPGFGTGKGALSDALPEPLALWLYGALAYAVEQKLPEAARTFSRAVLAGIRDGVLAADDALHRELEQAARQLEPGPTVPAEYDGIAAGISLLMERHHTRRVAGGPPIVVMGVAGSGKSTIAGELARRLGAPFVEGDSRHPAANVAKMAAGEPLTDADRLPWLDELNAVMREAREARGCVVVSCSALKRQYRERLDRRPGTGGPEDAAGHTPGHTGHTTGPTTTAGRLGVRFVYLHLDPATAAARVSGRAQHFMPSSLVDSQFAALERLEIDESGVKVDATLPVDRIVAASIEGLGRLG
jgi:gluconokinase